MLYVSGLATACSCVFDLPVYRDAGGRAPPCSDGSERGPDLGVFSHLAWVKMTHEASMGSGRASFPFLLCFYKAEIEVSITCAAPPSAGGLGKPPLFVSIQGRTLGGSLLWLMGSQSPTQDTVCSLIPSALPEGWDPNWILPLGRWSGAGSLRPQQRSRRTRNLIQILERTHLSINPSFVPSVHPSICLRRTCRSSDSPQ